MKVYLDKPIPKVCGQCTFSRKVNETSFLICFLTGKCTTKISTERPSYCPIEEAEDKKEENK